MKLNTMTVVVRLAITIAAASTLAAHAATTQASASGAVSASVPEAVPASAVMPAQHSSSRAPTPAARATRLPPTKEAPRRRKNASSCAPNGTIGTNGPYAAIGDPTLVTYDYDPDCTFTVRLKTNQETHLVFSPDEEIVGVYLSNTGKRWLYHAALTKRDLFIEARLGALTNAATVITTRRRYELDLRSFDAGRFIHRVSWEYSDNDAGSRNPDSPQRSSEYSPFGTEYAGNVPSEKPAHDAEPTGPRIDLVRANFAYKVEGDAPFAPTLILDDGRFTYLELPHNARLPAVMVMDAHGEGEITDLIALGNDLYEVPQITEYGILLRRDKDEIRIYNENANRCGGHDCAHAFDTSRAPQSNALPGNLYGKS